MQQARPPRLTPALPIVPYSPPPPPPRVRRRDRAKKTLTKAMRILRDRVLGQRKPPQEPVASLLLPQPTRLTAPLPHNRMREVLERDRALIEAHGYIAHLEEQRSQNLRAARRSAFGLRTSQTATHRLSAEGWTPTIIPRPSTAPKVRASQAPTPAPLRASQAPTRPPAEPQDERSISDILAELEALPFIEMGLLVEDPQTDVGSKAFHPPAPASRDDDGAPPAAMDMLEDEDDDNRPPVPIRTRTMARLLASQGKAGPALEIYEELIAQHPEDSTLIAEADTLRNHGRVQATAPARLERQSH